MNILRLIEMEFSGDTNPGNYMGPELDAFGVITNNSDEVTHTPESEEERAKRKKEKEEMETVSSKRKVSESSKDILDELLDDPKIQAMLASLLGNIRIAPVHESKINAVQELVCSLLEDIGPASSADWKELSTFDAKDVLKAIEVETEHTPDKKIAAKIALAHFKEDPNYYKKLARVEGEKPYVKTS